MINYNKLIAVVIILIIALGLGVAGLQGETYRNYLNVFLNQGNPLSAVEFDYCHQGVRLNQTCGLSVVCPSIPGITYSSAQYLPVEDYCIEAMSSDKSEAVKCNAAANELSLYQTGVKSDNGILLLIDFRNLDPWAVRPSVAASIDALASISGTKFTYAARELPNVIQAYDSCINQVKASNPNVKAVSSW